MPADAAAEAEAPLTECALKVLVLIPARSSIDMIHLAMDDEEMGLCGFTYDRSNLDFLSGPVPLKDSVLDIYDCRVTFGHNFLSEGKAGKMKVATDLEGLDCLAN